MNFTAFDWLPAWLDHLILRYRLRRAVIQERRDLARERRALARDRQTLAQLGPVSRQTQTDIDQGKYEDRHHHHDLRHH